MLLADRFDRRAVTWSLRVLGLALVVDVLNELHAGVWRVHTGELYPWRHLGLLPLYPPSVLAVEWAVRIAAGLALALAATRPRFVASAVKVAAAVLLVAVLERYSNHGALLFLIAFFLSIQPPDVTTSSFDEDPHPALGLVRAELVIVYVFSAINKVTHGFFRGQTLVVLVRESAPFVERWSQPLAVAVIVAELALPLLLMWRPRAGLVAVIAMHAAFAALIPNVASFGIAMVAMALLFQGARRTLPFALRS